MGIMASAIQMVENVVGKLVQGLLMPKVAPAWYAGTRRLTEFPEASAESLLLLGFVTVEVSNLEAQEAALQFFLKGLSAKEGPEIDGAKVVQLGASQLRLVQKDDPIVWPGQFYIWVEDSKSTLSGCQAFEKSSGRELIHEVHHIKEEGAADAMLLQDPAGNTLVINQAPVGGMASTMRSVLPGTDKASNVLALLSITYPIPPGHAGGVVRFYSEVLGAAMSKTKQGYSLEFSLGRALHQTLTFVEDEDVEQGEKLPEVCLFVVSLEKLKEAFQKCTEAGIVEGSWEEAEKRREFCFDRCPDPTDKKIVLELRHRIRAPDHPEWPLPRDLATRAMFSELKADAQ